MTYYFDSKRTNIPSDNERLSPEVPIFELTLLSVENLFFQCKEHTLVLSPEKNGLDVMYMAISCDLDMVFGFIQLFLTLGPQGPVVQN